MADYRSTAKGQNLYQSFAQLQNGYQTGLPGHTNQLRTLAQRPIGG